MGANQVPYGALEGIWYDRGLSCSSSKTTSPSPRHTGSAMTTEALSLTAPEQTSAKPTKPTTSVRGPRLWPAIVLVSAHWAVVLFMNTFYSATFQQFMAMFYSPMVLALGTLIWWLGFSR